MSARFGSFCAIDWSGAKGARHPGIAVALADGGGGPPELVRQGYIWSRTEVLEFLQGELPPNTLVGLDLGIALPLADCSAYFPGWDASPPDARGLWALVDGICAGEPGLGANAMVDHAQAARFFRRHGGREGELFRCDGASHGRGRFRVTERAQEAQGCRPYSNFNLVGAAQVGKASLSGMRLLNRLTGRLAVWPVDPAPETGTVIVEIYTAICAMAAGRTPSRSKMRNGSALNEALASLGSPPAVGQGPISDHAADALLAAAWLRTIADDAALWSPAGLTPQLAGTEGWTFGVV